MSRGQRKKTPKKEKKRPKKDRKTHKNKKGQPNFS
jgi:hypothetical protein